MFGDRISGSTSKTKLPSKMTVNKNEIRAARTLLGFCKASAIKWLLRNWEYNAKGILLLNLTSQTYLPSSCCGKDSWNWGELPRSQLATSWNWKAKQVTCQLMQTVTRLMGPVRPPVSFNMNKYHDLICAYTLVPEDFKSRDAKAWIRKPLGPAELAHEFLW